MLTNREREVVRLIALSNKEIARELGITEGTVKVHLVNIFAKMKVRNRTQLAIAAAAIALTVALPAAAQPFYGDPYDAARANQWRYLAPNVYRAAPPPLAYAPLPPVVIPPPVDPPPPVPLGWVYRYYAPCADPDCSTLVVSVGADGLNVRALPRGPVMLSLVNGTPLIPMQKDGDWVLVAPACALVPTWTWSWTAGVPLSVCL